mmetsp:Transcript_10457/g.15592  ORF Transcript_10457/g.15592 Transcript_10457/m.15592 type:complete len:80 (-) Transcript_10457:48-287(-)
MRILRAFAKDNPNGFAAVLALGFIGSVVAMDSFFHQRKVRRSKDEYIEFKVQEMLERDRQEKLLGSAKTSAEQSNKKDS